MKLKKELLKVNSKQSGAIVKKIIEAVQAGQCSKSYAIESLLECGLDVKEVSAKLGIRYNFAYNVASKKWSKESFEDIKSGSKINFFE